MKLVCMLSMIIILTVHGFSNSFIRRSSSSATTKQKLVSHEFIAINTHNTCLSMANANDSEETKSIEPKYLAAIGVVIFGVLWDFFITHHGQVYLAHP